MTWSQKRQPTTKVPPELVEGAVRDFQRGIEPEKRFQIVYDRYYLPIQNFLRPRVFSPEERFDLTQESFLNIYQGLGAFRSDGKLDTWVFRIVYNCYLKWLERQPGGKKAVRTVALNEEGASAQWDPPRSASHGDDLSPLSRVLDAESKRLLRDAIDELPKQMRRCLLLRLYQDWSVREIANALHLSAETVKVHLFQARKKLRERLGPTLVVGGSSGGARG